MAFFWVCVVLAITYNQGAARPDNGLTINGDESPYSMQLNKPQHDNKNIFTIPRQLEVDDTIIVHCKTSDNPRVLRFGLISGPNSTDLSNIACQLEILFPPHNTDKLSIILVQDGVAKTLHTEGAQQYYNNTDSDLIVSFRMRNNNVVSIHLGSVSSGSSALPTSYDLGHDMESIRFLSVQGDFSKVNSLDFKFG